MRRFLAAVARLYWAWRFQEETAPALAPAPAAGGGDELDSLRRSLAREEQKLEDYRRYRCEGLARPCESSIRSLRTRIRALEMRLR